MRFDREEIATIPNCIVLIIFRLPEPAECGLNIAVARQRSQMENSEPMVFSMNSIRRRAFNDYLLDLFIDKLGLVGTLIKSHRNFQELRNTGVIRA